jgi:uncharacterized protein (TIGR02118 family)
MTIRIPFQRMSVLQKKPGMDQVAFRRHWRQVHGPLAARMPGLKAYRQSHVVDQQQRVPQMRGPDEIDGFAQLWFGDEALAKAASAAPESKSSYDDLGQFVGAMSLFASETNIVMPMASPNSPSRPRAKRMTLLYAKAGMSRDAFRHAWFVEHGDLVARFPAVRGYHQHLVTARLPVPAGIADAKVDCQGVLEMWFDSIAEMDAAFASPEGQAGAQHASTFLSAITTYVVEEVVVL